MEAMTVISLTFDDGYLQHYDIAKKLYHMDIQAAFFIITGLKTYAGKDLLTSRPELIKDILDMAHEIGSHTETHRDLTALKPREIEEEFANSLNFIRRFTDEPVGLAYPYGSFNQVVVDIARKYFAYARTMGSYNRWNSIKDRFCIGGMGARYLPEIVLKRLFTKKYKLAVLVFHEDVKLAISTARLLNDLGFEIKPLGEAVKIL
jgi:peptidoglycan/xylan/chitin deacetylase (PgdA/CDA1 family)